MDDQADCDFAAAFSRVHRKIAQWRQRRRRGARIPEELWREAGQLARAQGINRTARALRLDYNCLKKRATAAAGSCVRVPEFVEMLPGGMPASRPACLIEVEDPGGAKLRIRLEGGEFPDVAVLTRVFREGGS